MLVAIIMGACIVISDCVWVILKVVWTHSEPFASYVGRRNYGYQNLPMACVLV